MRKICTNSQFIVFTRLLLQATRNSLGLGGCWFEASPNVDEPGVFAVMNPQAHEPARC
ncbi:hypothetical protein PSEUDO8Z_140147 [Pseudomonas sp. 8Z]|nr:hypothetical protein PSEUDO8Z_140147 [Pseudomonas sp. 8Z]